MNLPQVIITILNYNRAADTIECINSLRKITYSNYRIIIIDNYSTDNSVETLRSEFPDITIYCTDQNTGYTGGVNFGFYKAMELNPKYILVLNNDTIVDKDFLSELANALEQERTAAAAGGLIIAEHDRSTIWYAGGRMVPWRGLAVHDHKGKKLSDINQCGVKEVDFLTGCMILFRTEYLSKTGLEDEKYFLYLDDIEFSSRITRSGFKMLYVPSATIYHKVKGEKENPFKLYYSIRNRMLLISQMNSGYMRYLAYSYFMLSIIFKLALWFFSNRLFFHAAKDGLADYFRRNFYSGSGMKYLKI